MPKPSKATGGVNRTHSRSSSSTKLGANLQFTQKDLPLQKHTDKSSKKPEFARSNSNQRLPLTAQQLQKPANGKYKPGFTISSPTGHEDDDEWISSESGAATPNHQDSSIGTDEGLPPAVIHSDIFAQPTLTRVDTVRSFNLEPPRRDHSTPRPDTPPQPLAPSQNQPSIIHPMQLSESESTTTAPNRHSPIPKRYSRPPSTHSGYSRMENPLRPHPLIRGQSYGQVNAILPKPAPLAPLTFIIPNAVSHSSPTKAGYLEIGSNGHHHEQHQLSSSPRSQKTSSPVLPDISPSHRRTSFSSTGSINTIPTHSSSIPTQTPLSASAYRTHDRTRTLSTLSSSSAALSSLTHLPYVLSQTRPPSPNLHTVSFFPPANPQHVNTMEGIHPLLPAPYLNNHLTVLVRRTPIRESFDRVARARTGGKK
jgi:hypothetical protein